MSAHQLWTWIKNNILSLTTVAVGIIVLILESSGQISPSDVGKATLALVALLATSEIVERQRRLSKLEEMLEAEESKLEEHDEAVIEALDDSSSRTIRTLADRLSSIEATLRSQHEETLSAVSSSSRHIIESLDGVEVIAFESGADLLRYASQRFLEATRVEDVTWGESTPLARSREYVEAWKEYQGAVTHAIASHKTVWREVAMFHSASHWKRERQRILDKENVGYSLAYYRRGWGSSSDGPPLKGFAVIDDQEVLLSQSRVSAWLSIKHPDIARFYSGHFDDLWSRATKLKVANEIHYEEIEQLTSELEGQETTEDNSKHGGAV